MASTDALYRHLLRNARATVSASPVKLHDLDCGALRMASLRTSRDPYSSSSSLKDLRDVEAAFELFESALGPRHPLVLNQDVTCAVMLCRRLPERRPFGIRRLRGVILAIDSAIGISLSSSVWDPVFIRDNWELIMVAARAHRDLWFYSDKKDTSLLLRAIELAELVCPPEIYFLYACRKDLHDAISTLTFEERTAIQTLKNAKSEPTCIVADLRRLRETTPDLFAAPHETLLALTEFQVAYSDFCSVQSRSGVPPTRTLLRGVWRLLPRDIERNLVLDAIADVIATMSQFSEQLEAAAALSMICIDAATTNFDNLSNKRPNRDHLRQANQLLQLAKIRQRQKHIGQRGGAGLHEARNLVLDALAILSIVAEPTCRVAMHARELLMDIERELVSSDSDILH